MLTSNQQVKIKVSSLSVLMTHTEQSSQILYTQGETESRAAKAVEIDFVARCNNPYCVLAPLGGVALLV